jgi:hypothetical protein
MPFIDIIVVGKPLIEVLAARVVIVCDVMVDGSPLTARRVAGVIIVIVGIVVFMLVGRCIAIVGMALLMAMGCCMFIMGIIILPPPPGGLASALLKNVKKAHVARTARRG